MSEFKWWLFEIFLMYVRQWWSVASSANKIWQIEILEPSSLDPSGLFCDHF